MSTYSLKARSYISTAFSLVFFTLLVGYLGFIEFFQDARIDINPKNVLESPIDKKFLKTVQAIRFQNRIGEFSLKKENSQWFMYQPKNLPAQKRTIRKILKELSKITIHTVHQYEQINLNSFSLDKPIIELDLIGPESKTLTLKFGIINRINETSYMTVSGENLIFQMNTFKTPLESLELIDFVDAKIFSMEADEIKRFALYHGNSKDPYNVLEDKGAGWISKKYKVISQENTNKKINSILNIKTHMIIDKTNEELDQFINNYLNSPLYRINIRTKENKNITYKISTLIKAINELKIEKREYFLVKASNRPYPFLVSKSNLDRFIIRYANLKR